MPKSRGPEGPLARGQAFCELQSGQGCLPAGLRLYPGRGVPGKEPRPHLQVEPVASPGAEASPSFRPTLPASVPALRLPRDLRSFLDPCSVPTTAGYARLLEGLASGPGPAEPPPWWSLCCAAPRCLPPWGPPGYLEPLPPQFLLLLPGPLRTLPDRRPLSFCPTGPPPVPVQTGQLQRSLN